MGSIYYKVLGKKSSVVKIRWLNTIKIGVQSVFDPYCIGKYNRKIYFLNMKTVRFQEKFSIHPLLSPLFEGICHQVKKSFRLQKTGNRQL
jgi:hypothetical protein